jgi:cystathionine gamma-lyase
MSPAIDLLLANGAHTNGVHPRVHGIHGLKKRTDGFGTRVIHVGSEPNAETGAVIPPISLSTTYKQDAIGVHRVCLFTPYQDNC